jgi:hypothetical protein
MDSTNKVSPLLVGRTDDQRWSIEHDAQRDLSNRFLDASSASELKKRFNHFPLRRDESSAFPFLSFPELFSDE